MLRLISSLCLAAMAVANTPMPHPDTLQRSLAEMAKRSLVGAGCDQTLGGTDFKYVSNLAKLKLPQPFYTILLACSDHNTCPTIYEYLEL